MLNPTRIAEVLGERQRVIDALDEAHAQATNHCDPSLLRLCEQRVAKLLGADAVSANAGRIPALDAELERVALAFIEQWVIDVASVTDKMVSDLSVQLGGGAPDEDALMDFVHGLLVVEQRLRLGLAWDRLGLAS